MDCNSFQEVGLTERLPDFIVVEGPLAGGTDLGFGL